MWVPPRPGIEPMSPALAGAFFTTEPPGKPYLLSFQPTKNRVDFPTLCHLISLRTHDPHFTGDKTKARSWGQNND